MKTNQSKLTSLTGIQFSAIFLMFLPLTFASQVKDSNQVKMRKNVVRFNLTNPVFFGESSFLIGYERVLNKHQSMTLNVGNLDFGKFFFTYYDGTSNRLLQITNNTDDRGFHGSLDYRFYLKKENKFYAPRGIYIAPFYSYNFFQRVNSWYLSSNSLNVDFNTTFTMHIHTVGVEMGYQFILWKRLALDFILFGPGIANYGFRTQFSTSLDPEDQREVLQNLFNKLEDKLVGLGWVMDGDDFVKKGSTNTTALGFRYMIHLGFNF